MYAREVLAPGVQDTEKKSQGTVLVFSKVSDGIM
jgi:hypothetical protein